MRTAEEFRSRQMETLARSLQRPGFYCGWYGDLFYGEILRDLMWLENRPESDSDCVGRMLGGSRGVFGQFHFQNHVAVDGFQNEIASTFAEAAYRLGYYVPKRLLTDQEYDNLLIQLTGDFFQLDHTQSELVSHFGPPSHDVLGGQTTVHCYAPANRLVPWICFDYSRCYPPADGVTHIWFDEEILRDVRRSHNKFELLPFARWFQPTTQSTEGGEQSGEPEPPITPDLKS